jgi:hypothetical protein
MATSQGRAKGARKGNRKERVVIFRETWNCTGNNDVYSGNNGILIE